MYDGDGEVTNDGPESEAEQAGYDQGYESEWETEQDENEPLTLAELVSTVDEDRETVSIIATFRLRKVNLHKLLFENKI